MHTSLLVALLAGVVLPIQALLNGRMATAINSPIMGGNISFLVATICLFLAQVLFKIPFPTLRELSMAPVLVWFAGVLGAVYVVGAIVSMRALGPTTAFCLIVTGQIVIAIALEFFGIGTADSTLNVVRLSGAALVVIGAVLVVKF